MPDQESPQVSDKTRADTLQGLADALVTLAKRMQQRESAAKDFARLVARADSIAAKARQIQTSKWGVVENAAKLAEELAAFAKEVTAAAARAAAEMSGNADITDALLENAQRLGEIARIADTAEGRGSMAAALRPLETTLSALHVRMERESTLAADAGRLAQRAVGLAKGSLGLRGGGRDAEATAAEIQAALNGFIGEAGSIAARMNEASSGLREAAAGMALRTKELTTRTPAKAVTW